MSLFSPSVKQGKKTFFFFFKLWCINDHLNSQWTQQATVFLLCVLPCIFRIQDDLGNALYLLNLANKRWL